MNKSVFIAGIIILFALFGGMNYYLQSIVLWVGSFVGWIVIIWALSFIARGQASPLLPVFGWLAPAVALSTLVNIENFAGAAGRIWLYAVAIAGLIVSNQTITAGQVKKAIWGAGVIWPAVWSVASILGWWDHQNIVVYWSVLFVVVILAERRWLYLSPHLIMMFWLGSRGAIIASLVSSGLIMWFWMGKPRLGLKTTLIGGLGSLAGVWGMVYLRYHNAMARIWYWREAIIAIWDNPVFGIGLGLKNTGIITEPPNGTSYQIHAHNIFLTWLAETGLIGIICLGGAAWYVTRRSWDVEYWQLSFLAGLLVWSLVDEPLFWPGPLLITAVIAGTIKQKG